MKSPTCTLALLLGAIASGAAPAADQIVNVEQGWSSEQKNTWYTRSQGSRLLPLAWLRALEQPDSDGKFLDPAHMEKFRYLPNAAPAAGQLPVGFAIDDQSDLRFSPITKLRWKRPQSDREPWVGLNCAACHTAEITFQGKRMRVEGGPTLATAFLAEGLVDKMLLFVAPALSGSGPRAVSDLPAPVRLHRLRAEPVGEDVLLTAYVHEP